MTTLYAASSCPRVQQARLIKRAQGECLSQRALPPTQPRAIAVPQRAVQVVALGLSLTLSLGLLQAVSWGMGQSSGGVSLARHLQQPRTALQLAQTAQPSVAPAAMAPLVVRGQEV